LLVLAALAGSPARAGCPPQGEILALLASRHLETASRTARFEEPPPIDLYDEAARVIGEPAVRQTGQLGVGVLIVEMGVASLWKAVNDEDHFALDGHLPVGHSQVLQREPGGSRLVFQYFEKWGIGRFWVSRVSNNADLFARSSGALWEVWWKDDMEHVERAELPHQDKIASLKPLGDSVGAWLLAPLAGGCTAVEYFTRSDAGGIAGLSQRLFGERALKSTLLGLVRMATTHIPQAHSTDRFCAPDGAALGEE
jgi:hypothetical protein